MKKVVVLIAVAALAAAFIVTAGDAAYGRIKLAALPERERVEIQLENGRYTLVEEERIVPLLAASPERSNNMIDFSWSNTQIDKDSIQFRPIAIREGDNFRPIGKVKVDGKDVDEVGVINVSYPPNENALVWEVYSNKACAVKVRVSYLISNLSRTFSYRALADKDEKFLVLKNYMDISNYSGEEFGTAGVWAGFGSRFVKAIGQEEDMKLLMHSFDKVPVEKTFTFDWYANGPLNAEKPLASKVVMNYLLYNDEKHALGKFPLQPGKVRIFIKDGKGGEAFLGEDWSVLTPLDGKMKLYLGEARDIVCTRIIDSNQRQKVQGNLFNQEITIKYEIENFKDTEATLGIREDMNRIAQEYFGSLHGDVEWESMTGTDPQIEITYDEQGDTRPLLKVKLAPRPADKAKQVEKKTVKFHFIIKNLWS